MVAGAMPKQVLHGQRDARRGVLLHLGDGDEYVAVFVGVVQIEGWKDVAALGNLKARVLAGLAEPVGVFELDARGGGQDMVGDPSRPRA